MKTVHIELTNTQKQKLYPIQDALGLSNQRGKPGMVIAQVLFTGRDAVAVVGMISNEKALKVQEVLKPSEKGKMMTDKMTQRRLAKARK